MQMSSETFADFERDAERVILRIANLGATDLLMRLERLTSHFDNFLSLQFETDDTPYGVQWAIVQTHKLLVAVGGRLVQLQGTLTAEEGRDLRILEELILARYEQIILRVSEFVERAA